MNHSPKDLGVSKFNSLLFSAYPYPLDLPPETIEWKCIISRNWWYGELKEGKVNYHFIKPVTMEENIEPLKERKKYGGRKPGAKNKPKNFDQANQVHEIPRSVFTPPEPVIENPLNVVNLYEEDLSLQGHYGDFGEGYIDKLVKKFVYDVAKFNLECEPGKEISYSQILDKLHEKL